MSISSAATTVKDSALGGEHSCERPVVPPSSRGPWAHTHRCECPGWTWLPAGARSMLVGGDVRGYHGPTVYQEKVAPGDLRGSATKSPRTSVGILGAAPSGSDTKSPRVTEAQHGRPATIQIHHHTGTWPGSAGGGQESRRETARVFSLSPRICHREGCRVRNHRTAGRWSGSRAPGGRCAQEESVPWALA